MIQHRNMVIKVACEAFASPQGGEGKRERLQGVVCPLRAQHASVLLLGLKRTILSKQPLKRIRQYQKNNQRANKRSRPKATPSLKRVVAGCWGARNENHIKTGRTTAPQSRSPSKRHDRNARRDFWQDFLKGKERGAPLERWQNSISTSEWLITIHYLTTKNSFLNYS